MEHSWYCIDIVWITSLDLMLQAVQFKENPYVWSDTADDVTTGVSQLQLKRGEDVLNVADLREPIEITIPQAEKDYATVDITLQFNFTTIVEFNKTREQSIIVMFLDGTAGDLPEDAQLNVAMYDYSYSEDLLGNIHAQPVYNASFGLG